MRVVLLFMCLLVLGLLLRLLDFSFILIALCRIILYAIAMADYDQENMDVCKDLLKTKDGIDRLAMYQSSIGRLILVLDGL